MDTPGNVIDSGFETPRPSPAPATAAPKKMGVSAPCLLKDGFHQCLFTNIAHLQIEIQHRGIRLAGDDHRLTKGSGSGLLLVPRGRECMLTREFKSNTIKLTTVTLLCIMTRSQ